MSLLLKLDFVVSLCIASGIADPTTQQACISLATAFPNYLYYPGSAEYDEFIDSCACPQARAKPACVLRLQCAEEVPTAITILGRNETVKFAIRGGGHNISPGFKNSEDGVTIDLASINSFQLSTDQSTVSIGSGARWQQVYKFLNKTGLSVQGSRSGDIGVSDFSTGGIIPTSSLLLCFYTANVSILGGIGFYSSQLGFVCDSVTNFEVALSNGTLINTNATFNPDLFVALKGGSNNFGVVTRFDMKTLKQAPMFQAITVYIDNSTDLDVFAAFAIFKAPMNFDEYAMAEITFSYDAQHDRYRTWSAVRHTHPEMVPNSTISTFFERIPHLNVSIVEVADVVDFAQEKRTPSRSMEW
jgi:FAD/FMN-containing dehydrogenase